MRQFVLLAPSSSTLLPQRAPAVTRPLPWLASCRCVRVLRLPLGLTPTMTSDPLSPIRHARPWLRRAILLLAMPCGALLPPQMATADSHEQHDASPEHAHGAEDEHGSTGHAHAFEIGLAPGLAYVPQEKSFALGLHLHLVANIGETRWGLGAGVERLFDDHGHTTLSVVLQFRIFDPWSVIVAPGMTFPDGDASDVEPSVHFETAYEFMFGRFHIGPSFEVAIDPHATHLTIGLHMGVGI